MENVTITHLKKQQKMETPELKLNSLKVQI
jgi:hypothetical protein